MRNTLLSCTFLLLLFLVDFHKSPESNSNIQPAPFFLDVKNYIVPIIENEDSEPEYRYTRTLKIYYTDPTTKKVYLSDGLLSTCCSKAGKVVTSIISRESALVRLTTEESTAMAVMMRQVGCAGVHQS